MSERASSMSGLFAADPAACTACGQCVKDCPAGIIAIEDGLARVDAEDAEGCIGCQHCLAVCPTAAVSVVGRNPADSPPVRPYDPSSLEAVIRGRRSVRQFAPGGVDRALLDRVLDAAANAPTGVNARYRRFSVILDPEVMAQYRDRASRALVAAADRLPEDMQWLASAAGKWVDKGRDVVFRNAPHLIVATAGPYAATPVADCLIALSSFDLLAQANGIGTVWCGMVEMMLRHVPETRTWLGIPEDHTIGYAMLFGKPGVHYARAAQHKPEDLVMVEKLKG